MKNFIEKLSKLEGAAMTLGNILIGRVIGQVARGFGDDPEVHAQANLYLALRKLYPEDVVDAAKMWGRMVTNAPDHTSALKGLDLTEEEKAEWAAGMGESERDRIRNAVKPLMALLQEEGPSADLKAWYDLPPLAQHSLAVRTERNLWNAFNRYTDWTSEEGVRLKQVTHDSIKPYEELVGKLCESLKDELDQARSNGINVAERDRQAA